MSVQTSVGPIDWADGEHEFRLRWGELIELQQQCDAGPGFILARMFSGQWRMEDISHIIRLGLIGAGMKPGKALNLVRSYVESRPPRESLDLAISILGAAVDGILDGEEEAEKSPPGEAEAPLTEE